MKVGDRPVDFTELDQHGNKVTLSECKLPTVLAFLNGLFDKTPDGSSRMTRLQREFVTQLQKLKEKGLSVIVVSANYFSYNAQAFSQQIGSDLIVLDDSHNYTVAMDYSEVTDLVSMYRHHPIYLIDESFTITYASEVQETQEQVVDRLLTQFARERVSVQPSDSTKLS